MREAVEIVRRLFAGDRSGFGGDAVHARAGRGLRVRARVRDHMPLMIGTWKPRMAALAGRIATR